MTDLSLREHRSTLHGLVQVTKHRSVSGGFGAAVYLDPSTGVYYDVSSTGSGAGPVEYICDPVPKPPQFQLDDYAAARL